MPQKSWNALEIIKQPIQRQGRMTGINATSQSDMQRKISDLSRSERLEIPGTRRCAMVKILLVEDNEMNRDMLARRLKRKGYDIVFAIDGEEGVAMASSENPDLILMDLSLPKLNGWDATKRIRSTESISKLPIIALTAHAMAGDREKALEAGCDDYATKPIELEPLLVKIEALLKNKS